MLTYFEPQPAVGELPAVFPSPFDPGPPVPLARRAAGEPVRAELAGLEARHAAAVAAMQQRHDDNRRGRHQARAAGGELHALAQASRADTAERRRLDAAHRDERELVAGRLRRLD